MQLLEMWIWLKDFGVTLRKEAKCIVQLLCTLSHGKVMVLHVYDSEVFYCNLKIA